ncbi:MAG: DUF6716 putative glycosyltransferase, partial [Geminicoccaceae bacterium]|nr:DUF6716 putative glycosyltransferase [Geminicoccaceae bacterium]
MPRKFLICASADSQLKYGDAIAQAFAERGWQRFYAIDRTQKHVGPRQLTELGIDGPVRLIDPLTALDAGFFDGFDAIYVQSVGSALHRFFDAFAQRIAQLAPARRPILITGYVGLVIEKHLEGLLWRQGADLIAVNTTVDQQIFNRYAAQFGLNPDQLIRTGFPYARRIERRAGGGRGRTVLFAAQPTVPMRLEQRVHVIQALADYALRHPLDRVLIKPRALPGEHQFHVEKHHYAELLRSHLGSAGPGNLDVVYASLGRLLPETDLLATVSSTAAIEALAADIPTLIVADFGISETLGNHVFAGSGLIGPLRDLEDAFERVPEPAWLEANGFAAEDRIDNLVAAVDQRLAAQAA